MSIAVFGSINMDLVARTPHLPAPGETLTGRTFRTVPGGKGANQAVACARLGAHTHMIGRVGGDEFGRSLLASLRQDGIDITRIAVDDTVSSGVAIIAVDDTAENTIIIIPGANGQVGQQDLRGLEAILPECQLLLLQLELPLEMVVAAVDLARRYGVQVILDPAPARPLPPNLYQHVDILTPNTIEAETLVGFPVEDRGSAARAAHALLAYGAKRVTIKMGALGAYVAGPEGEQLHPAMPVTAVDTVAAGDAFNGALAVALAEDRPFGEAVRWALAGGACAVTKEGAQPSMPDREVLLALLDG
jgi:ribokinase